MCLSQVAELDAAIGKIEKELLIVTPLGLAQLGSPPSSALFLLRNSLLKVCLRRPGRGRGSAGAEEMGARHSEYV
jgi:hypothetical protein